MKNTLGMFEMEEVYRFAHRILADLGSIQNLVVTNQRKSIPERV